MRFESEEDLKKLQKHIPKEMESYCIFPLKDYSFYGREQSKTL